MMIAVMPVPIAVSMTSRRVVVMAVTLSHAQPLIG